MRSSLALLLLLAATGPGRAAPEKIEIPRATWEPIFFESINALAQKAGWISLRQLDVPHGALEVRVWIGFGESLQGIRLRRDGDRWTGFEARAQRLFRVRTVKPRTSWTSLWRSVESLGVLTLPDSSTLANENFVLDGVSYVVEINDGKHYRTYQYGNPQAQTWPEAKKIIEIVRVLTDELGQ